MIGRRSFAVLAAIAFVGSCSTTEETTPSMREAEEEMAAAGEAGIVLQDTFPAWRAAAEPPGGGPGPNAEAIVRGGAEGTHVFIDLDGGEAEAIYPWHIHSGECGDAQPPIVGSASAYSPIHVAAGDGGEGDAEASIDVALDAGADYIINVHLSPTQLDSIVACGELVQSSATEY